jgi:hypothetical protein
MFKTHDLFIDKTSNVCLTQRVLKPENIYVDFNPTGVSSYWF